MILCERCKRENDVQFQNALKSTAKHPIKSFKFLQFGDSIQDSETLEQWWEHEEWHEFNGKNQRAWESGKPTDSFSLIPLSNLNLLYSISYQFKIFSIANDPYCMLLRNMFDCQSFTVSSYSRGSGPNKWGMENRATLPLRNIANCLEVRFPTIILLFLSYTFPRTKIPLSI